MFSPQKVEKVDREELVFAVRHDQPLPWEADHELAGRTLRENQTWRHVVYLGIYRRDEVFNVLAQVFSPDENSYDERPTGESAIAAFAVGADGRAVVGSEVLSSCAWATGQVLSEGPGQDWVAKFQDSSMDFSEAWRDVVADVLPGADDNSAQQIPRVLDREDLDECLAAAVAEADTGTALSCAEIRIQSQIVGKRNADDVGSIEFLNSFIMSDLTLVAEQAARGNIGTALREYLRPQSEIPVTERIDVRDRLDTVLATTAPDAVPAGRWPSQPEHALAQNQQLAVNTALGMAGTGIMGVNGPPGTGKTTMLRDLIAALVVERARRLARLSGPKKAFIGRQLEWETGQYKRRVSVLQPDLTGFEVVVASTNNGAVENVTDEIPAEDAIGEFWQEQAAELDYFPEIATALLAPDSDTRTPQSGTQATTEGWALMAARLGKKANRVRFTNAFWYHKPDDPDDDDAWYGLLSVFKDYEQTDPDQPWSEAVAEFRTAEARAAALRAERSAVYQAIVRRAKLDHELIQLASAVSTAVQRVETARNRREIAIRVEHEQVEEAERIARVRQAEEEQTARQRRDNAQRAIGERNAEVQRLIDGHRANAERTVRSWEAELSRRWQAQAAHQQSRPGWWEWLRTFGEANRSWSRQNNWLAAEISAARYELGAAQAALDAAQRDVDAAKRNLDNAQRELDAANHILTVGVPTPSITHEPPVTARRELARAEQEITAAVHAQTEAEAALAAGKSELAALDEQLTASAATLGQHYPDTTWWDDRKRRELSALWTDAEWNTARSELFLAALALHKAFLQHTAFEMRRNLQAAMDLVGGLAPRDVAKDAALAAWQSLFLVVPVVSTTFASYARLFGNLGKEALGWLLIDEAGQATPQNAVGALWRTQRAVAVGDPLQLEPITTLPFRAEQAIRNEFGVDEQWLTSRHASVQRLADRITLLGTALPDDDGTTWVGVPLTVHRRCDQPMFDIVNAAAYNGHMINGTGDSARELFNTTYPTLPESKWIDVISDTARGHWIPDEGRQLDRILRTLADLEFNMSEVMVIGPFRNIAREIRNRTRRYPGLTAGTIHTAQGKQADVVILVLGSNPDRPGARQWAAREPNLLNVAVSRAKRRLYVIGDRNAWSAQRYFKTLAARLPYTTPIRP